MAQDTHSQNLWPIRPKPKHDELLSSWICRIAAENQMQTSALCGAVFPGERFTFREIDRTFDVATMETLAQGTGVSVDRIWEASLLSDSGYVFDFRPVGTTEWILPTASVDGESGNGLSYCPLCLAEDPYYRRSWRFAFNPACPEHRVFLRHNCPDCGKPYNYYYGVTERMVGASPIISCRWCGADLRKAPSARGELELIDEVLKIQNHLNEGIARDSFPIPDYGHVHARLYLTIYRACMVSLADEAKAKWVLVNHADELPPDFDLSAIRKGATNNMLEYRPMDGIAAMMYLGDVLMREWPSRFLRYAKKTGITPTEFFVSTDIVPYWVTQTAQSFFPIRPSPPCTQERQNAQKLLRGKLSRPESGKELRIFMKEGVVQDLYKPRKASKPDRVPHPALFKLEVFDPAVKNGRKTEKWGKALLSLTSEQLAKIAVLRQGAQEKSSLQLLQMDLFENDLKETTLERFPLP